MEDLDLACLNTYLVLLLQRVSHKDQDAGGGGREGEKLKLSPSPHLRSSVSQ